MTVLEAIIQFEKQGGVSNKLVHGFWLECIDRNLFLKGDNYGPENVIGGSEQAYLTLFDLIDNSDESGYMQDVRKRAAGSKRMYLGRLKARLAADRRPPPPDMREQWRELYAMATAMRATPASFILPTTTAEPQF